LGQAGAIGSVGGNMIIDAGTGVIAGGVVLGGASESVAVSSVTKTTTVRGNLVANTATVTGLAVAASLSVTNALTSGSASVAGTLTVTGTSLLVGSMQLGADTPFTVARTPNSVGHGRTTYVLGQRGASVASSGGDMVCAWGFSICTRV
jgi:hypothetical protein